MKSDFKYFISGILALLILSGIPSKTFAGKSSAGEFEDAPVEKVSRSKAPANIRTPSSENRENLNFLVTGDLEGYFAPVTTIGAGFSLGYFLDPGRLIELRYVNSYSTENYGPVSSDKLTMDMSSYSLKLTQFLGNSFNVGAFVQAKSFLARYSEGTAFYSRKETYYVKQSQYSNGLGFSIGNRWQWSHFNLGSDWVSVYIPLSVHRNSRTSYGDIDVEKAQKLFNDRTTRPDFSIRLMVGAAF